MDMPLWLALPQRVRKSTHNAHGLCIFLRHDRQISIFILTPGCRGDNFNRGQAHWRMIDLILNRPDIIDEVAAAIKLDALDPRLTRGPDRHQHLFPALIVPQRFAAPDMQRLVQSL